MPKAAARLLRTALVLSLAIQIIGASPAGVRAVSFYPDASGYYAQQALAPAAASWRRGGVPAAVVLLFFTIGAPLRLGSQERPRPIPEAIVRQWQTTVDAYLRSALPRIQAARERSLYGFITYLLSLDSGNGSAKRGAINTRMLPGLSSDAQIADIQRRYEQDIDTANRRNAIRVLGLLRDPRGLSTLLAALRDPDLSIQAEAAYALSQMDMPEAQSVIHARWKDLAQVEEDRRQRLPLLLADIRAQSYQYLRQNDDGIILSARSEILKVARAAIPLLLAELEHPVTDVHQALIVWLLSEYDDEEVTKALARKVLQAPPMAVLELLEIISRRPSAQSDDAFRWALGHPSGIVRIRALALIAEHSRVFSGQADERSRLVREAYEGLLRDEQFELALAAKRVFPSEAWTTEFVDRAALAGLHHPSFRQRKIVLEHMKRDDSILSRHREGRSSLIEKAYQTALETNPVEDVVQELRLFATDPWVPGFLAKVLETNLAEGVSSLTSFLDETELWPARRLKQLALAALRDAAGRVRQGLPPGFSEHYRTTIRYRESNPFRLLLYLVFTGQTREGAAGLEEAIRHDDFITVLRLSAFDPGWAAMHADRLKALMRQAINESVVEPVFWFAYFQNEPWTVPLVKEAAKKALQTQRGRLRIVEYRELFDRIGEPAIVQEAVRLSYDRDVAEALWVLPEYASQPAIRIRVKDMILAEYRQHPLDALRRFPNEASDPAIAKLIDAAILAKFMADPLAAAKEFPTYVGRPEISAALLGVVKALLPIAPGQIVAALSNPALKLPSSVQAYVQAASVYMPILLANMGDFHAILENVLIRIQSGELTAGEPSFQIVRDVVGQLTPAGGADVDTANDASFLQSMRRATAGALYSVVVFGDRLMARHVAIVAGLLAPQLENAGALDGLWSLHGELGFRQFIERLASAEKQETTAAQMLRNIRDRFVRYLEERRRNPPVARAARASA